MIEETLIKMIDTYMNLRGKAPNFITLGEIIYKQFLTELSKKYKQNISSIGYLTYAQITPDTYRGITLRVDYNDYTVIAVS